MSSGPLRRLGKAPAIHDQRTLNLLHYLTIGLPPAPERVSWHDRVGGVWPMFNNDKLGNCTAAAAGHHVRVWTANAFAIPAPITDGDVDDFYRFSTGYRGTVETDRGGIMLDVLKSWRRTDGPGVGGHRLGAFTSVFPISRVTAKHAVHLFGGIYAGLLLPAFVEGLDKNETWDVPKDGPRKGEDSEIGSWGGHAVAVVGYGPEGLHFASWGDLYTMTWRFFATYADEAYALFSHDFIRLGKAPNGFDIATLQRDLARLR